MRVLTLTAGPEDEGRAVRRVVPRRFSLGEHAFRRLKILGGILINGEQARADRIVHAGDMLEIRLPDSMDGRRETIPPGDDLCRVRYLDADIAIVAKGAPLASLPGANDRTDTLRERLAAQLGLDPASFAYHPVNRLDKGTSGLLCIARHAHAQRLLTAQLHSDAFLREYLAVTDGIPEEASGTIRARIAHDTGSRRCIREDGKEAVTHYTVEGIYGRHALIRLRLETGRTHQIRVHLAGIGCPITGDYLYGTEHPALPGRFALHSARLSCLQPLTRETISLTEPLPPALLALLS